MSSTQSYFTNNLSDYIPNSEIDPNINNFLKEKIISISDDIWEIVKSEDFQNDCIYSGNAGIAYMFWYLSQQDFYSKEQKHQFIIRARTLIKNSLESNSTKSKSDSFFFGSAGLYLVSSIVFDSCGEERLRDHYLDLFLKFAEKHLEKDVNNTGRDSLFEGRAGFVCGSLFANKVFKTNIIPAQTLLNIGISTIKSGKYNAISFTSALPIIFGLNFSAFFGMSGILLSLLCTPELVKMHPLFERDIKKCVDYILSQQASNGNLIKNYESEDMIDWSDGSAGVSWLMAKAFILWNEDKYKDSLIKCGELIWEKGLSRGGPGLSHGIAGNGYTFLLLFRLTSDKKYIHRAKQFANFIFSDRFLQECKTPDNPYSLFDGWAGTVCYFVDLLKPEEASFPLFIDVFKQETADISEDLATTSDGINDNVIKTIQD